MRTEVIDPPPPKRLRTVVLRAGPPDGRRPGLERVLGVLGLLLVLLAASLVVLLPEEDVLLPQFEVGTLQTRVNHTFDGGTRSPQFMLTEADNKIVIPIEIPVDNVNNIIVDFHVRDDLATSQPDVFEMVLYDAFGNKRDETKVFETGIAEYNEATFEFDAVDANVRYNYGIGTPPEGGFVTGARPNVTAEDVRQVYLRESRIPSLGTWEIHLSLRDAGDCPGAQQLTGGEPPTPEELQRAARCREASQDGTDTGNPITLEAFQYTYFDVQVSEL